VIYIYSCDVKWSYPPLIKLRVYIIVFGALSDSRLLVVFFFFPSIKLCRDHNDFSLSLSLSLRVEAVHSRVAELNPYVQVSVSTDVLDENTDLSFLKRYQVSLH